MKNITFLLGSFVILNFANSACGVVPEMKHTTPNRTGTVTAPSTPNANPSTPAQTTPGTPSTEPTIEVTPAQNCDFYLSTQDLCATLNWVSIPNQNDQGSFRLSFWNKTQAASGQTIFVNPKSATVGVKLWMPEMGHGSSPVKITQTTNTTGALVDGEFDVSNVYFVMPGTWQIMLQLKDANSSVLDTAKIDYQAN